MVAYGKDVKEVHEKAKKEYQDKRPLLAKIPKEKLLSFDFYDDF